MEGNNQMNKQRIIINCKCLMNERLKEQSKELTDKETNVIFNKSNILENCINDFIESGFDEKKPYGKDMIMRAEFQISEPTYLKLKAASLESGFSMTELIIRAYEQFNPDVNPSYDHLR